VQERSISLTLPQNCYAGLWLEHTSSVDLKLVDAPTGQISLRHYHQASSATVTVPKESNKPTFSPARAVELLYTGIGVFLFDNFQPDAAMELAVIRE
jgi:hypothetical protein